MQQVIPNDLVRDALDAVCSSAVFVRSPQHQRLLRYLVEELMADRPANLREIHLGVQVFGRSAAMFDPANDTIVRVEARRLRARLKRYYESVGIASRVVFELPLGSYIPAVRWRQSEPLYRDDNVSRPVLAVLPLDALGSGDDIEAWGDALTEEITDTLARLPDLRVVARTSAMQFKGVHKDIREIARTLAADIVIEGSLQQEGDQVRAIVQIIAANDGLHLWSDSTVGAVAARFRFFDIVSAMVRAAMPSVIATVRHELTTDSTEIQQQISADEARMRKMTANSENIPEAARDVYERGRIAIRVRTTTSIARATALFSEAIVIAPEYARAHAALAMALLQEVGMTMRAAADTSTAMRTSIATALSLDPHLAEAHATLGTYLLYYEHDWPNAERSLLLAIHFGPSYVSAYRSYAFGLMLVRRFEEADSNFARARSLDPLDPQTRVHHGLLRFYERRFGQAIAHFEGMLDADANNVLARTLLASACLHSGDAARAERLYREAIVRHPDLSIGHCGVAITLATTGRIDEAKATQQQLVIYSEKAFVSPYQFAMIDCALGDDAAAISGLERAAKARDYNFLCSAVDPTFDRLRGTEAWKELMRRHGMPET